MATVSETFNFVYSVKLEDGHYVINHTDPVATGVTVTDDDAWLTRHDSFSIDTKLGHDHHHHHGNHEDLTFVTKATDGAGDQGFIAKDDHGHLYFFTQDEVDGHHVELTREHGAEHICFMPGTLVRTPAGEVAVEHLVIGDQVLTSSGETAPVRWIGRQTVSRRFLDELRLPVRIRAGALAAGVPCRDLVVSPDHAILVEGVLVQAGSLVNGSSILRERDAPTIFTYYHVEVDDHALILAENTPAETFIDNVGRMNFDNWHEHEALYPQGRIIREMPLPRAKAQRQVPGAIRQHLAERAEIIAGMRSAA